MDSLLQQITPARFSANDQALPRLRSRLGLLASGLLLAWVCLAWVCPWIGVTWTGVTWTGVAWAQENEQNIRALNGMRLELPENWQALEKLPHGPLRLDLLQENDALFLGGAMAQADQAFTLFSLTEMSAADLDLPVDFSAKDLQRLNRTEEDELRARLDRLFAAELQRLTPFTVEQSKTMRNNMNGQELIMLTARCRSADEALIINRIYYFPPGRVLLMTFVSPTDIILFIAPDIAYILEHFEPEADTGPAAAP